MERESVHRVRYVGIIADGPTDRIILSKVVDSLIRDSSRCESIKLGQKLRDSVDAFWDKASKTDDYRIAGEAANRLKKAIISILIAALPEFQSQIDRELRSYDLLVLNTDAERHLAHPEVYFEEWAIIIPKIFTAAVEEFYHIQCLRGNPWESLPLITSLILFPSTDILVAAAKEHNPPFAFHGKRAREIKRGVYGVEEINSLNDQDLEEKALRFIDHEGCRYVYKYIPESRIFLHALSWNAHSRL